MGDAPLQWHPAFRSVMEIELEEEREYLQFLREYNLTKKPLQIDLLIIKMQAGRRIQKNLGQLFRQYNIVEYKSPEDYLSINDFYKVTAYACLYQSDTEKISRFGPMRLRLRW